MPTIIPPNRIADLASLYAGFPYDHAFVEAIFDTDCPSYRVWADALPALGLALACHRLGVGILAGTPDPERLHDLLACAVSPEDGWPAIRFLSLPAPEWVSLFQGLFGRHWAPIDRVTYRVPNPLPVQVQSLETSLPDGYTVQPIDRAIAERVGAEFDLDFAACWPKVDDFLRRGIGFAVLVGTRVASIAYAAMSVGRYLEISVTTHPEFRGRGLCGMACAPLLRTCTERNIVPLWNAYATNLASLAAAQKLGLQREQVHPWLIHTPWNGARRVVSLERSTTQAYTGSYSVNGQGGVEMVPTEDGIAARFFGQQLLLPLLAEDATHFFLADRDMQFVFPALGDAGQVTIVVQGTPYIALRQEEVC